jgi:P27 family predicted phage terminase small subunit
MGNKKKPTALEKAQGCPGHRGLNLDEPKPPSMSSFPKPPKIFDDDPVASQEWKALGPILFEMGLITPVDLTAFMNYCKNRSRWLEAEEDVQLNGITIEEERRDGGVTIKKNPAVTASVQYQMLMYRILTEFGMTPSSRARLIGGGKGNGSGDDLDSLEAKAALLAPVS